MTWHAPRPPQTVGPCKDRLPRGPAGLARGAVHGAGLSVTAQSAAKQVVRSRSPPSCWELSPALPRSSFLPIPRHPRHVPPQASGLSLGSGPWEQSSALALGVPKV